MSDGFDQIFLDQEQKPVDTPPDIQDNLQQNPEEDYYDYDAPVFPKLNPLQITLIVLTLLMLVGFGVFYVHRTSAQNNSSPSTLTPIPTSPPTDTPALVIPSQTQNIQNTNSSMPQTNEGGQPIVDTPTPTPPAATATPTPTPIQSGQPTPTATSAPTPTPTEASTITPTTTPTDTPTQ
jgi:hypothetical protein